MDNNAIKSVATELAQAAPFIEERHLNKLVRKLAENKVAWWCPECKKIEMLDPACEGLMHRHGEKNHLNFLKRISTPM